MNQLGNPLLIVSFATVFAMSSPAAFAQDSPAPDQPAKDENLGQEITLWDSDSESVDGDKPSLFDNLQNNLRANIDIISRVQTTSRRGEAEALSSVGLDLRKVFSDEQGDIGTAVLQPYLVRKDNAYMMPTRMIDTNQDDAFSVQLHDFYFDITKWGRGRTNIKLGHFDVPFGIEPLVDTHFTLRQYQTMHDAGFKKDWGVELTGEFPNFDYAVSVTTGTGLDLTGLDKNPHLLAGRIGTPADQNTIFGISALYGDVIDDHGAHRVDEGDPREPFRQIENMVRRWRFGLDATHMMGQWTARGETAGGMDFDQTIFDTVGEIEWTSNDEMFTAYLQGRYNTQDGFFGWDEDVQSRLGFRWQINGTVALSSQWFHEFEHYASIEGGLHRPEDTFAVQLQVRF